VGERDEPGIGAVTDAGSVNRTLRLAGFPHPSRPRVSRNPTRADADVTTPRGVDHLRMSYAVLWSEDGGPTRVGKLELCDHALFLDGTNGDSRPSTLVLDEIASVRIARGRGDRLQGRPVLILERNGRGAVRVATLSGVGALHELAELVGARDAHAAAAGTVRE
jgi:hypothetical protein